MIDFPLARRASELARSMTEEGYFSSTINYQISLLAPSANGFERNRAILRGQLAYNIQTLIRGGTPPFRLNLPYPYPPSTGPETLPNLAKIVSTVLIETPGMPDKIRTVSADGVGNDLYSVFSNQLASIIAFWTLLYPGSVVSVLDPSRYIY